MSKKLFRIAWNGLFGNSFALIVGPLAEGRRELNEKCMVMTSEETKESILLAADGLFRKSGVRVTTIDDVCRAVGISKKTFYQLYPQKEDLVASVCRFQIQKNIQMLKNLIRDKDVVEVLKCWLDAVENKKIMESDKRMMDEINKYYPDTSRRVIIEKSKTVRDMMYSFFEWGIEEGFIRSDLDIEATIVLIPLMHTGIDKYNSGEIVTGFRKVSVKRLLATVKMTLVRSLLSAKGLERYESLNAGNVDK